VTTEQTAPIVTPDVAHLPLAQLISLEGRVAVVTGGGRGIGQAIAARLAEAGASVIVADLDEAAATDSASALSERATAPVSSHGVDVADGATVRALAEAAVARAGSLDIWVNAAGIYPIEAILEMDDAFWDRVINVNLRGSMIGAREAARQMVALGRGGVILNLASITGFRAGSAGGAAYVASKHGVVGLTKSLAVEFGSAGIRSLAIAPATVMTPGMRALEQQFAGLVGGDFVEMMIERVQLGRVAVADDIARVALFCVSDLAAYMTGSTVLVDGGDMAL
jgi:NAD(P)-dependent dehydrogenase (short-subunit alcohol dehydrogenase family)